MTYTVGIAIYLISFAIVQCGVFYAMKDDGWAKILGIKTKKMAMIIRIVSVIPVANSIMSIIMLGSCAGVPEQRSTND